MRHASAKALRRTPVALGCPTRNESSFVVVSTPRLDDGLGLAKTHKPMSIQTLVPKTTVETFDKGVLDGTTRFDEVEDEAAMRAAASRSV